MDEVTPKSLTEHAYAAFIFVGAYWTGNVIISNLTSHMTQIYLLGSQRQQKLNLMRRYLHQNGVSKTLTLRVQRNAQYTMKLRAKETPESAVGLENLVSTPLRIELHFEMYAPTLQVHTWFDKYAAECPQVVRKICHSAMSTCHVSTGDVLFHQGEPCSCMCVCKKGSLR